MTDTPFDFNAGTTVPSPEMRRINAEETTLVWLDLETTGLDPKSGEILELAAFATDLAGNPIQEPIEEVFTYVREDVLAKMDDYVLNMHLGSGLLSKVWTDTAGSYSDSDPRSVAKRKNEAKWRAITSWFNRLPGRPKTHFLAGNSIHLDRSWLAAKQPDLLRWVSHRMLDVSTLLIIDPRERKGDVAHRALADAEQSFSTYHNIFLPRIRTDLYSV